LAKKAKVVSGLRGGDATPYLLSMELDGYNPITHQEPLFHVSGAKS
jgi:hypothetical protein